MVIVLKNRAAIYQREAAEMLHNISLYPGLTEEQLCRFFPEKEATAKTLLAHMLKEGRIFCAENGRYYANQEAQNGADKDLSRCVWVLLDFIDQVEYHTVGEFPAAILCFANGELYEIVPILNWRILREEDIGSYYEKMANNSTVTIHRSWQDCVQRLLVRGLIVVGAGDTEYDALYDLLACRFIIPIGAAWPLRVLLFLKLTFLEGISWKITRRLFHVDARSVCEKKVIRLARQTSLSCAEIIKCIEMGIRRLKDGYDVLDKLYDDNDLNCDNFAQAVREYHCSREVITAVVNLYLRQQIMIDTY